MTSRKACAADDNEELPPSPKRRRRVQENATVPVAASLDSVNDDCLLLILSYINNSSADLNSVAVCGRRYLAVRNHESLDQTRMATIVISEGSTAETLLARISDGNWSESLQRNHYTRLRIVGLERLESRVLTVEQWEERSSPLAGITSLDLAYAPVSSRKNNRRVRVSVIWPLTLVFPALEEVTCSFSRMETSGIVWSKFLTHCLYLEQMTWKGYDGSYRLLVGGGQFQNDNNCFLTRMNIDDSRFRFFDKCFTMSCLSSMTHEDERCYTFVHCRNLEYLSIKNLTCYSKDDQSYSEPLSQEMLIKMIRRHPLAPK